MAYNLTEIGNSTGLLDMVLGVNTELMRGHLGNFWIIALWFIAFTSFYFATAQASKAFTGAFFICFLLSILLVTVGLLGELTIFIMLIGLATSLAVSWKG